ncbi:MAG TPA: MFS transporter [Thermomicrobiales bacterium]|nr:MFS transporter [Thermomicrobiales bacterium]
MSESTVKEQDTTRPPGVMTRLRSVLAEHPRAVWSMALGNLILWTGRGMTIPFLVIFFSQIVGLRASIVGSGIAMASLGGIGFLMLIAGQIDRRGGRPVLLVCMAVIAVATSIYPWGTSVWTFLTVTIVLNFASQVYWPASDSTIASLTARARVAEAMSVLRVANAVGIGVGGMLGGAIVAGGGLHEYRILFVVSALMIASAAVLIWRTVPAIRLHATDGAGAHGTWADVLPDRTFIFALVILFILVFGFTQITMSVPAYLREAAGIGEGTIGALFLLNTIIVVSTQIPVAAWINRGQIGRPLVTASVLWAIAFMFILATPHVGIAAAVAAFVIYTAGEILFMPVTAVVPVRLAPLHLRGRYFSATSIVWGGSFALATFTAGIALDLPNPGVIWPMMTILMLIGGALSIRFARSPRVAPDA